MNMNMNMDMEMPSESDTHPMFGDGNTSGRVHQGHWTGHLIPSFAYLMLGVCHLSLLLYRARRVSSREEFIEKHIPEKDPQALKTIGMIMTTVCGLGIAWEAKCLVLHPSWGITCPLDNIAHHSVSPRVKVSRLTYDSTFD